ncbi:MAG: ATP-dependent DNA helicase [Pseudomonadota bacterium]
MVRSLSGSEHTGSGRTVAVRVVTTPGLTMSVRQLVERCCIEGDLHATTGARVSGREGTRAHQRVQRQRLQSWGDDYQSEVQVSSTFVLQKAGASNDQVRLTVRGRLDGLIRSPSDGLIVEEIKTIRGEPDRIPSTLQHFHWSQVMLYAAMLLREHDHEFLQSAAGVVDGVVDGVEGAEGEEVAEGEEESEGVYTATVVLRLCYFDLQSGEEYIQARPQSCDQLSTHLTDHVDRYSDILRKDWQWQRQRDGRLRAMSFPMQDYRPGQYELSRVVYSTLRDQGTTYLQAPTGLGKTLGCLFPAVKALPYLALDRVFYLTARQSAVTNAERAMSQLRSASASVRSISITAREKVCLTPGARCDGDECQYAKGYYSRRKDAISQLLATDAHMGAFEIDRVARAHRVCPFELSLDTARHMDVIICDYNYVFDPVVYLRRFFDDPPAAGQALLIDEVHNLVDRGREMFSATLSTAPMNQLMTGGRSDEFTLIPTAGEVSLMHRLEPVLGQAVTEFFEILQQAENGELDTHTLPVALLSAVRELCLTIETLVFDGVSGSTIDQPLNDERSDAADDALLSLYFVALRFLRASEWFDDSYRTLVTRNATDEVSVTLMNVNPASMLSPRFEQASAVIGFSATLSPKVYFQTMLGGESADWYRFTSPFPSSHQGVFVVPYVSTGWRDRRMSADRLVDLIEGVVRTEPGNYLICFPSYQYLADIHQRYVQRNPTDHVLRQHSDDDQRQQQDFLDAFENASSPVTGFAVLGGRFSEGIDLVGRRLIGVIVVGVGLPQIGPERDLIREHFDDEGMDGFRMAYQYPGLNRVLQGAGRVIRTEQDTGIICLVDGRFARPDYTTLLPQEWQKVTCQDQDTLIRQVTHFWETVTSDDAGDGHRGGDDECVHVDVGSDHVDENVYVGGD